MMTPAQIAVCAMSGGFDGALSRLCAPQAAGDYRSRIKEAAEEFARLFGSDREVRVFSAPGRIEVGGNHTDHQNGRVLAAAVNLDTLCIAAKSDGTVARVKSKGYSMDEIDFSVTQPRDVEAEHAASLVRGVAVGSLERGYSVGGFDAYTVSDVLKGSGLSSSAAFEVSLGTIISGLFNGGGIPAADIAMIGQYAENKFFGKPSGLMDQMASAVGGFVAMDFETPGKPLVTAIDVSLADSGYAACIVDTKGSHSDLIDEYAAIPADMRAIAEQLGKRALREADEGEFYRRLTSLRQSCGDRAVLRAIHFFGDNNRVTEQQSALVNGDFQRFIELVVESGRSSASNLQNIFRGGKPREQGLSLALALSERLLAGRGGWRVHGGGFAGTILAFVPVELVAEYSREMDGLFGPDSCRALSVRPVGGVEITPADRYKRTKELCDDCTQHTYHAAFDRADTRGQRHPV